MGGAWVKGSLYAAALATGASFSILFTGNVYDEFASRHVLASGGGAFWAMFFASLVALLVGSAGRYRFILILPATALYTLLAVYGWPPVTIQGWRELSWRIGGDIYQAAGIMYTARVPYDLQPGILVLLIPLAMFVVTFATSATLYERSPIISVATLGLTIGVLSTISFEDGAGSFFAFFLISAVSLLLATGRTGRGVETGGAGIMAGAAAVLLVLLLPVVAGWVIRPPVVEWTKIGVGSTSRLAVQADVGDYLTTGRDSELMRVRSPEPVYMRAGTLNNFDGVRWTNTLKSGKGYGEEVAPGVKTRIVRQDVEILNARTNNLFGAYKIISPSIPSATEASDGSWTVREPLAKDSYYGVISRIPQPTSEQLQDSGTTYPASVRRNFLQLPDNTPPVVDQTARKILRKYKTRTPYDKARAIETYLLYDGGFTYNLDVHYRRANDAIEAFLGKGKQGFCTQFATSMALLARDMGVPSRVVYGSTSGQKVGSEEYLITGANMHLWVELYFPNVGWYTFDPTPGFSVPTVMQKNAPRPSTPAARQELIPPVNRPATPQADQPVQENKPKANQKNTPSPDKPKKKPVRKKPVEQAPVWPLYLLVPILAAAAVPLGKRAFLARGRPEDLYGDLIGRLRDVLPPGGAGASLADSASLTPTERLLLLAGAVGVEEEPFRDFARCYSSYLYSAAPEDNREACEKEHREAVREFEELPRWRRLLGVFNPASLVARVGRALAGAGGRASKSLRGKLRSMLDRSRR